MEYIFKYFLNATLNFAFSFLEIVRRGKMLKILMSPQTALFEKKMIWHLFYKDDAYSFY
jgi:hypothetical protein